jgi:hypothetical protein
MRGRERACCLSLRGKRLVHKLALFVPWIKQAFHLLNSTVFGFTRLALARFARGSRKMAEKVEIESGSKMKFIKPSDRQV